MLKKWVKVELGSGFNCEVEVDCFETTSERHLQDLAKSKLQTEINKRVSSLSSLGASLSIISDFEKTLVGGR
jgi:hypothetical protein